MKPSRFLPFAVALALLLSAAAFFYFVGAPNPEPIIALSPSPPASPQSSNEPPAGREMTAYSAPRESTAAVENGDEAKGELSASDVSDAFALEASENPVEQPKKEDPNAQPTMPPEIAAKSPRDQIQWVLENLSGRARGEMLRKIIPEWTKANPYEAFSWARVLQDHRLRDFSLRSVMQTWAQVNPYRAAEALATLPATDPSKINAAREVAREMARRDVQQALTLADRLGGDAKLRGAVVFAAVDSWSTTNPTAAAEYTLANIDAKMQAGYLQQIGRNWGKTNPLQAIAYSNQLAAADHGKGDQMLRGIYSSWGNRDPAAAFRSFQESGSDSKGTAWHLGASMARKDGNTAAQMALTLPANNPVRESLLTGVMGSWTRQNPDAAAKFLTTQQSAGNMDRPTQAFVNEAARMDPANATAWALTIRDENIRSQALTSSYRQWLQFDNPAAQEWLRTGPLSAAERNRLQESVKPKSAERKRAVVTQSS